MGGQRAVESLAWFEAIIAASAIGVGEVFTEVVEEFGATAGGAFGVVDHFLELLAGDALLLGMGFFVDESRLFDDIT